jgi:cell division protein FtsB
MKRNAALAAAATALASCIALEKPAPPPQKPLPESWPVVVLPKPERVEPKPERVEPEPKVQELELLLGEFARLRRISAADLVREQEAARQAFAQTRSDASRIQLAMALTVPGGSAGEEARALDLLEPVVKNASAPLHALATLLSLHIQEQRRLTAQLQGLQQSNTGLQQNVQALQQNVQGLQQKLDALRTLERSLSERGETPSRKR